MHSWEQEQLIVHVKQEVACNFTEHRWYRLTHCNVLPSNRSHDREQDSCLLRGSSHKAWHSNKLIQGANKRSL